MFVCLYVCMYTYLIYAYIVTNLIQHANISSHNHNISYYDIDSNTNKTNTNKSEGGKKNEPKGKRKTKGGNTALKGM
jgi:hypothetical protein